MREVTATQAARQFSSLLTAVEHDGETFVITRGGRVIARVEPASGTSGRTVKTLLRRHIVDADWQEELASIRSMLTTQDRAWPG